MGPAGELTGVEGRFDADHRRWRTEDLARVVFKGQINRDAPRFIADPIGDDPSDPGHPWPIPSQVGCMKKLTSTLVIITITLAFHLAAGAQTLKIEGVVIDQNGAPVS